MKPTLAEFELWPVFIMFKNDFCLKQGTAYIYVVKREIKSPDCNRIKKIAYCHENISLPYFNCTVDNNCIM